MIKYSLSCVENKHPFEGWFKSSNEFDEQRVNSLLTCPFCDSPNIEKQIMAPNVVTSEKKEHIKKQITKIKKYIDQNFEDVGNNFAEEIIEIHNGNAENRPIQGKITTDDAKKLNDLELPYLVIPDFKEDA